MLFCLNKQKGKIQFDLSFGVVQRNEKLCNKLKTEINQNEFCQERDIQNGFLSSRYEIAFETKIRVEKLQADSII